MEKLIIFRMFLCFPLVGFLLPDIGIWLSKGGEPIPLAHIIVEAALIASIAISTVRISVLKKRQNSEETAKTSSF
jgi:hypothetical protein